MSGLNDGGTVTQILNGSSGGGGGGGSNAALIGLVFMVVILAIFGAGYYVLSIVRDDENDDDETTPTPTPTPTPTVTAQLGTRVCDHTTPQRGWEYTVREDRYGNRICPPGFVDNGCGAKDGLAQGLQCRRRTVTKPTTTTKPPGGAPKPKPPAKPKPKPPAKPKPKPAKPAIACDHKKPKKGWEYTRRVDNGKGGWKCPKGYKENGCDWNQGVIIGELQCRRKAKATAKTAGGGGGGGGGSSGDGAWLTATQTYYYSWPECCKGSPAYDPKADKEECTAYDGCKYQGDMMTGRHMSYDEVKNTRFCSFYDAKNMKSSWKGYKNAFWDKNYSDKFIWIRQTGKPDTEMKIQILDTCKDSDTDNNDCTRNAMKSKDGYLIDLEINTARAFFGADRVKDMSQVEWKFA